MASYFIAIKDKDGDFAHYKVSEPVKRYIKQLENCIRHPEKSKLKEEYPDRF